MNGAYIEDMVAALSGAGISDAFAVDAAKWSGGTALDAGVGVFALRDEMVNFPIVLKSHGDGTGQFNLVGYSFGSLVAAQVAAKHVRGGGVVDHLVLIGAPISKDFLDALSGSNP